ncbi:histidine phosphatase family protein [Paenibacillus ginsengarvi]|uniref:Histidine phosphatase family protein n=1 Tax=Paenibacillus ginsengarvi TaxID=400777 RepID=A0A3B0CAT2_9BACL|nr:histidine phosphatase family protein [Paenibacillus ginsengarvi]RKN81981.1 histidine phosphatase family protein [Paenibacillus ginsengarvi]
MTTITFVRHGITDFNREKRAQGHLSNPLNETGILQAKTVAKRLAGENWDVMFSSDLWRARQTADIIAEELGIPVSRFDVRLREIGRGQLEGTIEEERIARWGPNWRELDLGEESHESVRERGKRFVGEVAAQYAGQNILVVSHGFLIGQTLKAIMQDETTGERLGNTSVTAVVRSGNRWEYQLYNCMRHLDPNLMEA